MDSGTSLALKSWSADDTEMDFQASDCFDGMDSTYYRGQYHPNGMSLYDIAVDVLTDAQVDYRNYWIDPYLKDVLVVNPMPVVMHKEALQLIANAGRCILYQDRAGRIILKSSFVPDMSAASDNETYFSPHCCHSGPYGKENVCPVWSGITQAHPVDSISFPGRPMELHILTRAMCLRPSPKETDCLRITPQ